MTSAHTWQAPPPGQSGLQVCSKCGARRTSDVDDPEHPQHACSSYPADSASQAFNANEYDPIP